MMRVFGDMLLRHQFLLEVTTHVSVTSTQRPVVGEDSLVDAGRPNYRNWQYWHTFWAQRENRVLFVVLWLLDVVKRTVSTLTS